MGNQLPPVWWPIGHAIELDNLVCCLSCVGILCTRWYNMHIYFHTQRAGQKVCESTMDFQIIFLNIWKNSTLYIFCKISLALTIGLKFRMHFPYIWLFILFEIKGKIDNKSSLDVLHSPFVVQYSMSSILSLTSMFMVDSLPLTGYIGASEAALG